MNCRLNGHKRLALVVVLLATGLGWAQGPAAALAQTLPGGQAVPVPGSTTLTPGATATFEYAPGCPRGVPGGPPPSCGCCGPRLFSIKNDSDQTVGVSYSLNMLDVLMPDGYTPELYLLRPDFGYFGCEPVAGRANEIRCAAPLPFGAPPASVSATIRTHERGLPPSSVAIAPATGVALVAPDTTGGAATPTGLAVVNRSVLPAQLLWSGTSMTLTVLPGYTPLLTAAPATRLSGCEAVDEQPEVLSCTVGVDRSLQIPGAGSPPADVARLSFTAIPGDAVSERANVEPSATVVFVGTQADPVSGTVPMVTVQHLAPPGTIGGVATWDGATLTLNASPATALTVAAAENATCAPPDGAGRNTALCATTGVPAALIAFVSSQDTIQPLGPPVFGGRIVDPPESSNVGESLTFTADTGMPLGLPQAAGLTVARIDWDFGDGGSASGATVTHTYADAGTYTVSLTVQDSHGTRVGADTTVQVFPAGAPVLPVSVEVNYPAGWNLVAGASYVPDGIQPVGSDNTLLKQTDAYTLLPDGSDYGTVPQGTPLAAGVGYWAYFASPTNVTVAGEPRPLERVLPAQRWTLIGNPFTVVASVSGADAVYVYNPDTGGYAAAETLEPGQGAWAYSSAGGVLRLATAPDPLTN